MLVSREAGFHVVEFNASDQRNKSALEAVVAQLIDNRGIDEFWSTSTSSSSSSSTPSHTSHPTCVIMDEVDGISGNEDRGGLQHLISLIKRARLPIICIANDASSPKMKTLKSYTLHLTWRRPTTDQIVPRLNAIAVAEGLDVDVNAMRKLIEGTQADIRQAINFLQMYSKTHRKLAYDTVQASMDRGGGKDFDTGVFEVIPTFFKDPGRRVGWGGRAQRFVLHRLVARAALHSGRVHQVQAEGEPDAERAADGGPADGGAVQGGRHDLRRRLHQ